MTATRGGINGTGWDVIFDTPTDTAHVIPFADTIDHQVTDACICGPTPEPVHRPNGSVGWLATHHSLDNREANER